MKTLEINFLYLSKDRMNSSTLIKQLFSTRAKFIQQQNILATRYREQFLVSTITSLDYTERTRELSDLSTKIQRQERKIAELIDGQKEVTPENVFLL